MATVKLENITKRFDDVIALDNITFDVHDKEFFVLLGQTGAGKTTMLRCIAGLDKPEEGSIYLNDVCVNDKTPAARDVAFVFQSHILYPHLTVYDNMAFPLHPRKLPIEEIDRRVKDIAGMLHIEHLLRRMPGQLSGGETQRVGLGRAMVRRPQLFLMDEPISNLDAKLRVEMRGEIRWRQRALKTTTFYVTHEQIEAMSMADRIAVLEAGKIQQLGTPSDIYNHPATLFVANFIGSPSMNCIPCEISSSNAQLQFTLMAAPFQRTQNSSSRGSEKNAGKLSRNLAASSVTIQDVRITKAFHEVAENRSAILGVHPEDVIVSHQLIPNAFQTEVYSVEPLGAETIVELTLGTDATGAHTTLKSRAAPNFQTQIGESLYVTFVPERLHFFDKTTGEAIWT